MKESRLFILAKFKMKKGKLRFKIQNLGLFTITIVFMLSLFAGSKANAAELFFNSKVQKLGIGQEFRVDLFLNTENDELNAVEGNIVFPDELTELKEIRDGNSIISFWVERPKVVEKGKIVFSGIIPGGYKETKGLLFSAVFFAKKDGEGGVAIHEIQALKNDGLGTPASVKVSDFLFSITAYPGVVPQESAKVKDSNPPEKFKPEISQVKDVFDGKYFLVFATQDKGSGIDHYEVREGLWNGFVTAESPYLLQNQKLDKKIFVKAVDKADNKRTEILYPPNFRPWYKNYWILGILIIIGLAIAGVILRTILWQKFIKSR